MRLTPTFHAEENPVRQLAPVAGGEVNKGVRASLARMAVALAVFANRAPATARPGMAIVVRDDGNGNVSVDIAWSRLSAGR